MNLVGTGATSGYLAIECDSSDSGGLRDGLLENESASLGPEIESS